jgi:CHAT domain-containing protein/tetratricopeptide (TPR) repeat protein
MIAVDDPRLPECLLAFGARDYLGCYRAAIRGRAEPGQPDHPVFRQLIAICLQRLGQMEDLDELPRLMLDEAADQWEESLLRLTFGQSGLDEVRQAAANDEQRCQATYYAGARLLTIGRPAAAEELLRECAGQDVDCLERRLAEIELTAMSSAEDPDPADQAFRVFDARAQAYLRQGRFDEAIHMAEEACDLARRTWGQDNEHFASALITLLIGLAYADRISEAMEVAPLAVDLARKHYGDDDPEFANVLNTVAYLHKTQDEFDEARRLYHAAAAIWEHSAEHRRESATALNNIAQIEVAKRQFDQAEKLFRRVLDTSEDLDDETGLYATAVNNLAIVYQEKGDPDGAERLFRQALDRQREQFGEDHPKYAESLNNLAYLFKEQGRMAEAEPLYRRAAEILERSEGIRHPHTMMVLSALLEIYEATGQQEAADRLVAHIRAGGDTSVDDRRHVLHPVPGLTPLFLALRSQLPQTANEPEFIGGAIDSTSPSYQRLFAKLADAFAEGRYGQCVRQAVLLNSYHATHEVLQMFLMCFAQLPETGLGRTPQPGLRDDHEMMWPLITDPWQSALVGLTLGRILPAEVEELADDDEKFCQLLYYGAQRQMVEGHNEEALINLHACANSGVACFETWMAARILRAPPRASNGDLAARVRELNQATTELLVRGDFSAALSPAEEAWQLGAGLEENSQERTLSQYNLAIATYKTGNPVRAEILLQELLSVARSGDHYDRTTVGGTLNILGIIYTDLAQFDRAEPALLDALEELRLAGRKDDADYAQVLHNLAEVYREIGDLQAAIRFSQEALESKRAALGQAHPEYARTLNNLGLLYLEIDEVQTAEGFLEDAQRIRRAALQPGHADLASSAQSLGYLYLRQDRYQEAEAALRAALDIRRHINGTDSLEGATLLNSLGNVYLMTGRIAQARQYLQEGREVLARTAGVLHPYSAGVVANLAFIQALDGDLRGALELSKESEEATSKLLFDVFATASERQRLQLLGDTHLRLSAFLSLVAALDSPDDEVANAFDLVLRRKGLAGEAESAWREEMRGGNRPELRSKAEYVHSLREKIARKTLSGPGLEGAAAHRDLLASWAEEKERLEAELARAIPGMRLELRIREISGQMIRSLLPAHSALVEIVRFSLLDFKLPQAGEERPAAHYRYWAFVVRPEPHESLRLADLGDAEEIDRLVARYRKAVVRSGLDRDLATEAPVPTQTAEFEAGTDLRAVVFDRLHTAIGDTRRLFLCPDGDLSRLPWEVLPVTPDRRLIDDYEISYLGVGRDLLRLSVQSADGHTAPLVVADPDYDLSIMGGPAPEPVNGMAGQAARNLRGTGVRFDRLAGTSREGRAVAALLGVEPVMGAAATETAVKSSRRPVVLHVATHGFFLPDPQRARQPDLPLIYTAVQMRPFGRLSNAEESPFLRSGLALAGANTWLSGGVLPADAEDGILTAEDVSGMELSGTGLVTLSACETGLGSHHLGEGVLGLRRAFTLAGARTLVMSLWRVPDNETQTLMTDFYRRVLGGQGRAAALRSAQLELKKERPDPYYWGAFICQGDPGALVIRQGGRPRP